MLVRDDDGMAILERAHYRTSSVGNTRRAAYAASCSAFAEHLRQARAYVGSRGDAFAFERDLV